MSRFDTLRDGILSTVLRYRCNSFSQPAPWPYQSDELVRRLNELDARLEQIDSNVELAARELGSMKEESRVSDELVQTANRAVLGFAMLFAAILLIDLVTRASGPTVPSAPTIDLQTTGDDQVSTEFTLSYDLASGSVSGSITPSRPLQISSNQLGVSKICSDTCDYRELLGVSTAGRESIFRLPEIDADSMTATIKFIGSENWIVERSEIELQSVEDGSLSGVWGPTDGSPVVRFIDLSAPDSDSAILLVEAIGIGFALNFVAGGLGDLIRGRRSEFDGRPLQAGGMAALAVILGANGSNFVAFRSWTSLSEVQLVLVTLVPSIVVIGLMLSGRSSQPTQWRERFAVPRVGYEALIAASVSIAALLLVVNLWATNPFLPPVPLSALWFVVIDIGWALAALICFEWLLKYFGVPTSLLFTIVALIGLEVWLVLVANPWFDPWQVVTSVSLSNLAMAVALGSYVRSGSIGRAAIFGLFGSVLASFAFSLLP